VAWSRPGTVTTGGILCNRTTWSKKKQSNDAALFGALVGGFFGAASAPSHASGDQAFAQGLLGAASGAAGMAALESVLNGPTKSKASTAVGMSGK